jgi:hypothetical protein
MNLRATHLLRLYPIFLPAAPPLPFPLESQFRLPLSSKTNPQLRLPVFTPIMGLSILLGLVVYALRMRTPGAAAEIKVDARPVDALRS